MIKIFRDITSEGFAKVTRITCNNKDIAKATRSTEIDLDILRKYENEYCIILDFNYGKYSHNFDLNKTMGVIVIKDCEVVIEYHHPNMDLLN